MRAKNTKVVEETQEAPTIVLCVANSNSASNKKNTRETW